MARRTPRADTSPLDPQRGALHTILRLHLEDFIDGRERQGAPLPAFILDELRSYLDCGVLSAGCARFECQDCGLVRVTALSCKGRGFCPRCCGRRMSERARHLAERVFPEVVRVRQWVLSLPFELRVRAAFDHDLALALCRITTRAIESHYRLEARRAGLSAPRGGSVTLIQRFGSDLRTNLHFHSLCLDGVYVDDGSAQRRFFTSPAPSPADVERVLARIVRKARAYLASRDDVAPTDDEELALAQTHAAAARTQGAQKHAPDDAEPLDQVLLPTRRKARIERWDLDAEVAVHEHERLEHLCRYALRPPIALGRVKILGNDLIAIELQRRWSDGTTHISMSIHTFLGRLASLVPRPRANTTIYAGVIAANSSDRAAIVPEPEPRRERRHDASWAALMKHSFGIDVLSCRRCKGRMRFVAVVFDPAEVRRLLCHLRCFSDPLPIHPARGPPEHEQLEFP